jgi:hypothetical protein
VAGGAIRIALELIGAALGVWFAWKTKSTWESTTVGLRRDRFS